VSGALRHPRGVLERGSLWGREPWRGRSLADLLERGPRDRFQPRTAHERLRAAVVLGLPPPTPSRYADLPNAVAPTDPAEPSGQPRYRPRVRLAAELDGSRWPDTLHSR
jgi:hypothetical protein